MLKSKRTSMTLAVFALVWGGFWAWHEQKSRDFPLDVDGWAKITHQGFSDTEILRQLIGHPSLWKGPIVPTIYGLVYIAIDNPYTPIGVNILGFALSVGLLHRMMILHGGNHYAAFISIIMWVIFPPFRQLYGYYFAEPLIALFSTILFALVLSRPYRPFAIGLFAGIVLLARSPMLLVVLAIPWTVAMPNGWNRRSWAMLYMLGLAITFAPWGIRNAIVTGTYIPFTAEGGLTMYHGTHLEAESIHWEKLVQQPEVAKLHANAPTDEHPGEKMHYWSGLAKEQVVADLPGQMLHGLRKTMRFWMNVPDGEWLPTWKSGIPMLIVLPLGFYTMIRDRRHRIVKMMTLWIIGLWAMHAVVFGLLRYSYPVMPMMLFLAASSYWRPAPVNQTG